MEQSLVENFKKSASHLLTQCRETGFIDFFFFAEVFIQTPNNIL